jgi:dihydroorotase
MDTLIKNGRIINEGAETFAHIWISGQIIKSICSEVPSDFPVTGRIIDASKMLVIPGVIDDQVHFREPGLTYKGDIFSESRAAIAGGITSFMEMPNTKPPTLTQEELEKKYKIASLHSFVNYSFYMGVSNDNADEVLKTNKNNVCGIKIFLGASTGNMLVDNLETLNTLFSNAQLPIAVHCEDEPTIKVNTEIFKTRFSGSKIPPEAHPEIRNHETCIKSSKFAFNLAKKFNTRLHILHLSTDDETKILDNSQPLDNKQITSEVCVHHLWFDSSDYSRLGNRIKWNPAIKNPSDKEALWKALLSDKIDIIATDHAPHSIEEKEKDYLECPSGGPLVQHSLVAMLEFWKKGKISLEKIVEKMCHNPAIIFKVKGRGFIREGYFADIVIVDPNSKWIVEKSNILYKCKWSPFEGVEFSNQIHLCFVNGVPVYENQSFFGPGYGQRLEFLR